MECYGILDIIIIAIKIENIFLIELHNMERNFFSLIQFELHQILFHVLLFIFLFLFFVFFLGLQLWHMEVPRLGVKSELLPRLTPQPQQRGIWAASSTYTTVYGSVGSLTHWARPRIEPATSWLLVGLVNHWATMGTPKIEFLKIGYYGKFY